MLVRSIDFETTGIPTELVRHAVCEVGFCDIDVTFGDPTPNAVMAQYGLPTSILTKPGRPMPCEARAVHHIRDADIEETGVLITDAFQTIMAGSPSYFCAHNASFEREFFGGGTTPWLCSYKIALRIWPEAPSHSLQVLRYFLDLDVEQHHGMPPHRAGPDAYIGAALMARIFEENRTSVEEMVRWSSGPALLPRVPFGKHKGMRWEDVPISYLQWVVDKSDLDRDVKANARHHLKQRETVRA